MRKDYFSLAFSNLRRRGLRSLLTMIGIFVGIAAVVALISLGNSLREAITGQFDTLSADKLTIQNSGTGFGPPGSTVIRKLTEHDLDLIKKVNGVDMTISRLIRIAKFEYNKIISYSYVADIPSDKEEIDLIYESMNVKAQDGRLLNENDGGKIVLGYNFKENNPFEKELKVGSKVKIQDEEFEVIGILEKSSSFQINLAILMPRDDLKGILNISDEIDIIVAQIKGRPIEDVAKDIETKLRKDRNEDVGEEDFSVQTPVQILSSINTILTIINLIVTGIAAISLLVGGIGIANTMYTSVLERTKEIGIMKAIGAKNSDILWIFVIESGLLGLIGGIIGALMGLGLAFAVSGIAQAAFSGLDFRIQISYSLLTASILFSFFIGLTAGVLPAMQASKLKPADALRK